MKIREKLLAINRKKLTQFVGCIVFLTLLVKVFCGVTYLFRNIGYERYHIVGIEQEKNLDMVYIGGSAAFVYWQPMRAWGDCGFTSYSYATNTIQAEQLQGYLEEVRRTQDPALYVIGVRAFQYYSDEHEEVGLRNGTDAMDVFAPARYHILTEYFKHRDIPEDTDIWSYYFDIAKYHTNMAKLSSSKAWQLMDNEAVCADKGWEWIDDYQYLRQPTDFQTDERAELLENDVTILNNLLTYCRDEELNVLFVVCPYFLTQEDQAKYNTIGDIIESYGFDFLNTNDYYDEMKIDFATDFYNENHVNLFGAAKYTEFLEKYIIGNYNMPDHRGEEAYESWYEDYNRFLQEEAEHANTVMNVRLDVEQGLEMAEQMQQVNSLEEWYEFVCDDRYMLLVTSAGVIPWPAETVDQQILHAWGLQEQSSDVIRVVEDASLEYTNDNDEMSEYSGDISHVENITYQVTTENQQCSIIVGGEELAVDPSGMNIVVIDNNYRRVVDAVALECDETGHIKLYRE